MQTTCGARTPAATRTVQRNAQALRPAFVGRVPQHRAPPTRRALKNVAVRAALAEDPTKEDGAKDSKEKQAVSDWVDRFNGEPRKGCDVLVQALEREGVNQVFAYPGGASMEIHQALTRSKIKNYLCRHEQGEIFAAEGFGKCTGEVGVCIATSGPGATNLVTGLADALLDSVPMVAITGQVPRRFIGTDAFQETPIVEVTRQITKHNYLVMNVEDIPRVMKEAFYLARSGRPGPVLVDIPKDIQQAMTVPDWDVPISITGYVNRLPPPPMVAQLAPVLAAIKASKNPIAYIGGGCLNAGPEIREFLERTGIPAVETLMARGLVGDQNEQCLGMLGMHGTVPANYSVDKADLLLAFGARFDDRVTGKLEVFASRARIVHIDIDPAEIHKNKEAHLPICADVQPSLRILNRMLDAAPVAEGQFDEWQAELNGVRAEYPMEYPDRDDCIMPQWAIEQLWEATKGDAIVTTGVGQHQMWTAQYWKFLQPREWVTSGGLGSMGFGLPSAMGAAAAYDGKHGREKRVVVDIDGDGSFLMNCQELATTFIEKLDIKIMILNNQHLGMVVQWEDRFYKKNRAHTYLGKPEVSYHESHKPEDIYPDFVKMADSFSVPAKRVIAKEDLRPAIEEMLATEGPYLLEVMVPHISHVLPMIPGGGSFADVITKGDGENPVNS